MNRYRVTVSLKTGTLTPFYMNSECDKIEMLQLLGKAREVISILDVRDLNSAAINNYVMATGVHDRVLAICDHIGLVM